jgi:hypothetical protein
MRIALTCFGLLLAIALAGCAGGPAGGCNKSCGVQSNGLCVQSWDWYRPCDLVEGRAYRDCGQCEPVGCGCALYESRTIYQPVAPAPPPPPGAVEGPPPPQ